MTRAAYELRVLHGERELSRHHVVAVLDLEDPDGTEDLLNRHLLGAVVRAGGSRGSAHEYCLEVWPTAGGDRPVLRWALPLDGEEWWL